MANFKNIQEAKKYIDFLKKKNNTSGWFNDTHIEELIKCKNQKLLRGMFDTIAERYLSRYTENDNGYWEKGW